MAFFSPLWTLKTIGSSWFYKWILFWWESSYISEVIFLSLVFMFLYQLSLQSRCVAGWRMCLVTLPFSVPSGNAFFLKQNNPFPDFHQFSWSKHIPQANLSSRFLRTLWKQIPTQLFVYLRAEICSNLTTTSQNISLFSTVAGPDESSVYSMKTMSREQREEVWLLLW